MTTRSRGGVALLAATLMLALGATSVAAAPATITTFPLDARWSHEEPTGEVTWFDVEGDVRITTTADGRSSAIVHLHETQTVYLGDAVIAESRSVQMQHAVTIGEDLFLVHLGSRASWSYGGVADAQTYVLHIVRGEVVVEHRT
jgi:hypothetical protein